MATNEEEEMPPLDVPPPLDLSIESSDESPKLISRQKSTSDDSADIGDAGKEEGFNNSVVSEENVKPSQLILEELKNDLNQLDPVSIGVFVLPDLPPYKPSDSMNLKRRPSTISRRPSFLCGNYFVLYMQSVLLKLSCLRVS